MKNYISLVAITLLLTATLSAQNAVTLSQHNASISLGDSIQLSVELTVQPGFDASVFIGSWCNPIPNSSSINQSIINYPYTIPLIVSFKPLKYYKRGTYTIYVSASIGNVSVSDSCIVEVVNPTPWRIFNAIHSELRPTFITLDNDGNIYHSFLGIGADYIHSKIWLTNITNPVFTDIKGTSIPQIDVQVYNMIINNILKRNYFAILSLKLHNFVL
jgi:hypothetical protein